MDMLAKLQASATLDYKELLGMIAALQIVSGQSYAIGSIMALFDFVAENKSIIILKDGRPTPFATLSSLSDIVKVFKDIDPRIVLKDCKELSGYFR